MITYHYTMCGLDYVYLRNGFCSHDTPYGPGVSIEHADMLDRAIARAVLTSQGRIRGQEVRFLRSLMHQSQTAMATELGVKRITVARWEGSPNTPIPGPSDRLIRLVSSHILFDDRMISLVFGNLNEITDDRSSDIVMLYVPEQTDQEPSLFPEQSDGEGWRATKVA